MGRVFIFFMLCMFCVSGEVQGQKFVFTKFSKASKVAILSSPPSVKSNKPFNITMQLKLSNKAVEVSTMEGDRLKIRNIPIGGLKKGDRLKLDVKGLLTPFQAKEEFFKVTNPSKEISFNGEDITIDWLCGITDLFPPTLNGFIAEVTARINDDPTPIPIGYLPIDVDNNALEHGEAFRAVLSDNNNHKSINDSKHESLFYKCPDEKLDSVTGKWKTEFLSFLERHHFRTDSIYPSLLDKTSMAFISFYKHWRQMELVPRVETVNAYACYRFLTIDCNLKCNRDIKWYSNFIRRYINYEVEGGEHKEHTNEHIDRLVDNWFTSQGLNKQ